MSTETEATEQPADKKPEVAEHITIKDTSPDKIAEKAQGLKFTKSFIVDAVLDEEKLVGSFTVKRLTIGELGQYSVYKTQLNGGLLDVPETVDRLHEALAFLRFALVQQPDWFQPEVMYDPDVIYKVYNHCLEYQQSFRRRME